jgi:(p)ppGpp synthase/HD superfamily hydrolase
MTLTPLSAWQKLAFEYAARKHGEQKRKYTGLPYTTHLANVHELVHRNSHELIDGFDGANDLFVPTHLAAILHDTLEDTDAVRDDLVETFDHLTASLVMEVTDFSEPDDGSRAIRKRLDLRHLSRASKPALFIKLADVIDNARDISAHDKDFAVVYRREKREFLEAIRHRVGGTSMFAQAWEVVND